MKRALVTGAAGFVAGHLCHYLKQRGYWVRAVDIVPPRYGDVDCDESDWNCDLREFSNAYRAVYNIDEVYALAATMGGAGIVFSGNYDAEIMRDNTGINLNTLETAVLPKFINTRRYLFTSSACVYNQYKQSETDSAPLREEDAYPAWPDSMYGWEKLHGEHLCEAFAKSTDMQIRVARFHNVYGPRGAWRGGHEKLPAAACRKVAEAKLSGNHQVEVWGDGLATRSFCYIDDCTEMLYRLMQSDYGRPMNIGTDRAVSVNEVFQIVADIANIDIELVHVEGPQGVRGRNADLSKCREVLQYEPQISLEDGLARTYAWIEEQVKNATR